MNKDERSLKLYRESVRYYQMDMGWQNNFIVRCRRLARSLPSEIESKNDILARMRLDIISLRTGRNI